MARTVREEKHAARINEMLDAAQTLIYTKGYEQMTIQDMLDAVQCSKGAFYYYFDSKQALLEALVMRMVEQMMALLLPVVEDQQLTALHKLEAISRTAAGWKSERLGLVAALTEIWYSDENVLVRDKLNRVSLREISGLYQRVIEQGIAEGVMSTPYPDLVSGVLMDLMQSMGREMIRCLLTWDQLSDGPQRIARSIGAYCDGIERLLGIAPGSLNLVDPTIFYVWGEVFSQRQSARNGG